MQEQVVKALLEPEAYDEETSYVELVQTHISFIFLIEGFVYKVKKAVDLGFLDFTTLEKRRFFCERELELNKRLCKDMYLGVLPINKSRGIKIMGDGGTVEYAVKMKRMPQERMLSKLLEEGKVECGLIDRMAKTIAGFHSRAETNREISEFGSLPVVKKNWIENFQQTQEFIGKVITEDDFGEIRRRINSFLARNSLLLERRISDGRIRDCHGDIHSGNIFVTDEIYIFDAIEFNERFRFSDVASDIAFLAMDLDFKGRPDLSRFFVKKYVEYSKDEDVEKLLPFYKCYRAYVRGKVNSFRLKDPTIASSEMDSFMKEARAYFKLASTYSGAL